MAPVAAPYPTPIDVSKVRNELGVKRIVKKILDHFGWFWWMPGANGFGTQGVHDFLAIKDGVFLTVETKFMYNKPSATQNAFAAHIMSNSGFSLLVNEDNIDHLVWFLASFDDSVARKIAGGDVDDIHGSRMMNALAALTDAWAKPA